MQQINDKYNFDLDTKYMNRLQCHLSKKSYQIMSYLLENINE